MLCRKVKDLLAAVRDRPVIHYEERLRLRTGGNVESVAKSFSSFTGRAEFQPDLSAFSLDVVYDENRSRVVSLVERGHARGLWKYLMKQLDALWPQPSGIKLKPVTFPPGRAREAISPNLTGSATRMMTMGMVLVAFLAACAAGVLTATITSTLRCRALPRVRGVAHCARLHSSSMLTSLPST